MALRRMWLLAKSGSFRRPGLADKPFSTGNALLTATGQPILTNLGEPIYARN